MDIPLTFTGDFQAPDRFRGTLTMNFLGFSIESELISIGDTSYQTNPETGEWEVTTEPATPLSDPSEFFGDETSEFQDLVLTGLASKP